MGLDNLNSLSPISPSPSPPSPGLAYSVPYPFSELQKDEIKELNPRNSAASDVSRKRFRIWKIGKKRKAKASLWFLSQGRYKEAYSISYESNKSCIRSGVEHNTAAGY